MEYIKKDLGSYNVHLIHTKKFKTVNVQVCFRNIVKKEDMTYRNFLSGALLTSSKKYPSKRDINIKIQDLYSVYIDGGCHRLGNYIESHFELEVLKDKYTEKGNLNKSLDFLFELIFNPNVTDNKFDEENFEIIKKRAKSGLLSIEEDAGYYGSLLANEVFDSNSAISYRSCGYLEDLDNITTSSLYKYYKNVIKNDFVDIFVVGDFDDIEVLNTIKKYFTMKVLKKVRVPYDLEEKKARRLIKYDTYKMNVKQSRVYMMGRCYKLNDYEKNYVAPVFNFIFGGGPSSKLFREVREANSLCYTISSRYSRFDNMFTIYTGVDNNNYSKAVELTKKIFNDMKKGKFTIDDINAAKEHYNTGLDDYDYSVGSISKYYQDICLFNGDVIEEKKRKINAVTKNDIVKVAKKLKLDTIFKVEGVDSDEEM